MKQAEALGYLFNTGTECEFYLFKQDEDGEPTTTPSDQAGYFDLAPFDRGENTRREICLTLEDMGFEIESSRHEAGKGQHGIDFKYDNALLSADNMMTFKTVVKTVAQRNGLHASFLPKPLMDEPGSGMHVNASLIIDGKNIFETIDGELSEQARYFIAGVLAHIKGITAIANPLINSYKRFMGSHEAPKTIGWGISNHASLIRIPVAVGQYSRMELRSPDPTCNPYLTFAVILAAGLEGLAKKMPLMEEVNLEAESLPVTLAEAICAMEADALIASVLGNDLKQKYIELKKQEWMDYIKTVHPWEIDRYLSIY